MGSTLGDEFDARFVADRFVNHIGQINDACFYGRGQIELLADGTLQDASPQQSVYYVAHVGEVAGLLVGLCDGERHALMAQYIVWCPRGVTSGVQ